MEIVCEAPSTIFLVHYVELSVLIVLFNLFGFGRIMRVFDFESSCFVLDCIHVLPPVLPQDLIHG